MLHPGGLSEGRLVSTALVVLFTKWRKGLLLCVRVCVCECVHIQTSNVGVGITQSSGFVWGETPACSVT